MDNERCDSCKHYVALNGEIGLCCYSFLIASHVGNADWCECYEEPYENIEIRKEQK